MATMEKYLRALAVFCMVIFLAGSVLEAQPNRDVIVGVMVIRVNSERVEYLAATMARASTAEDLLLAVLADSSTKISRLQEVHASDGQKVTLRIGEGHPDIAGSFQPGTVGVSPLRSMRSQLAETGANFQLIPHVHAMEDVRISVSVEVSNVAGLNLSGLNQPLIAQRRNEADIRLRDGEVGMLGEFDATRDSAGIVDIPGTVNIPALGEILYGNGYAERYRHGLVIALIPHIVRASAPKTVGAGEPEP
jgi:Flp pilus assembly secretin CpaC